MRVIPVVCEGTYPGSGFSGCGADAAVATRLTKPRHDARYPALEVKFICFLRLKDSSVLPCPLHLANHPSEVPELCATGGRCFLRARILGSHLPRKPRHGWDGHPRILRSSQASNTLRQTTSGEPLEKQPSSR